MYFFARGYFWYRAGRKTKSGEENPGNRFRGTEPGKGAGMAEEVMIKENKMGTQPLRSLLLSMSLPIMISMIVQALYNVVDSIFVAMIEEDALTAVSLAFPVQNLLIAVSVGTAVGINALLARYLGEKEYEKANAVAENGVFMGIVCYILFLIAGLTCITPFYRSQTSSANIISYGEDYLSIICIVSIGIFIQAIFEKLLQATGKTIYTMFTQGTGAIINIILDPILIFGHFGFPQMGVKGAAVATVIGQCVAGILAVFLNHRVNKEIRMKLKGFRPSLSVIGHIYMIAVPTIVMQAIGSVMVYGLNRILIVFSSTATAVFGVYFKLQSFIFMPVFGLNNGMVPIVAYNYGAGKKERVIKTIRLAALYGIGIMLAGSVIMHVFPRPLLLMFDASELMLQIGVPALRIISLCFGFAGYCIVIGSAFQALGHAWYSMFVSIARQLLVLLPVAYLLAQTGVLNMVWWSFPIAEFMSVGMTTFFLIKLYRKVISHIGEEKAGA